MPFLSLTFSKDGSFLNLHLEPEHNANNVDYVDNDDDNNDDDHL